MSMNDRLDDLPPIPDPLSALPPLPDPTTPHNQTLGLEEFGRSVSRASLAPDHIQVWMDADGGTRAARLDPGEALGLAAWLTAAATHLIVGGEPDYGLYEDDCDNVWRHTEYGWSHWLYRLEQWSQPRWWVKCKARFCLPLRPASDAAYELTGTPKPTVEPAPGEDQP